MPTKIDQPTRGSRGEGQLKAERGAEAGDSWLLEGGRTPVLLRLALGAHLEKLADCTLLFCEADQQLHKLNETGAILAERLRTDATPTMLVGSLRNQGVDPAFARDWVTAFLDQAAAMGALAARIDDKLFQSARVRKLAIGGSPMRLAFASAALDERLGASYAHLESAAPGEGITFSIAEQGRFTFIAKGDGEALVVPSRHAAIRLKGLVLSQVLGAGDSLTALHAACLSNDGAAMLLLGSPGTGKTLLSLALLAHGFAYGGDDVALLRPGGLVAGVPLAPGVKSRGWDKAERLGFDLSPLPPHLRPDGRRVRFVGLADIPLAGPQRVGTIVRLRRNPSGPPAVQTLAQSDALADLMREAQSPDGHCSQQTMQALAATVRSARCVQLSYSEAEQAAALLCDG